MTGEAEQPPLYALVEIPKGSRNKYEYDPALGGIKLDRFISSPTFPGCVIPVEPIGVFEMTDEKGEDDKVLCVPFKDPTWSHMHDISDIRDSLLDEIAHFFDVYKTLEPGKNTATRGYEGKDAALREIAAARARATARP